MQPFEVLRTDQGPEKNSQTNRSLIKSIEHDEIPIYVQSPSKDSQEPQRAIDLIIKNRAANQAGSRTLRSSHLNLGPKYTGNLPNKIKLTQDDSPHQESEFCSDISGFSNKVWKHHALKILMVILRLIGFITKANFCTSFRLVTQQVFEIIGDKSAYFKHYFVNDFFKYHVCQYLIAQVPTNYERLRHRINMKFLVPLRRLWFYKQLQHRKFILRPESLLAIGWNIYILIILNINVLYVSARVAFKFDTANDFGDGFTQFRVIFFDVLPSYSFLLEIVLKFNTCYYHNGSVIEKRYLIARNYFRSSFLFDVFVIIPFFLSLRFQVDYLDLVLILKVFQIQKFSGTLFDRLELSANQIALFDLIKLGYTILAAAHFCACLWFLVGSTGDPSMPSWVKTQQIEDEPLLSQYFHSFYFSIVTMTTIGYGDITPQNLRERIFTIGMAVAAVGTFGYSIGNINNIYAEWSRKSYQYRSDMNSLKKYMRCKGINKHLQEKVRKYFEYIWTDIGEYDDRDGLHFEELIPAQLLDEMKIDMYLKIFKKIPFLNENFSESLLIELCSVASEQKYGPEQIIYEQGDLSQYLYIILNGSIQFYVNMRNKEKSQKVLETLDTPGEVFGQSEFFQNQSYTMSCKSTAFTYVLKLSRAQFTEILQANNPDYQKYCQLRDNISFMSKHELVGTKCVACNKNRHIIKDCPMVCGYPNRAKVLLNHRRNIPADRTKNFRRVEKGKVRSLQELRDVQSSIYVYLSQSERLTKEIKELAEQVHLGFMENEIESDSSLETSLIINCNTNKRKRRLNLEISNSMMNSQDTQSKVKELVTNIRALEKHHNQLKNDRTLLPSAANESQLKFQGKLSKKGSAYDDLPLPHSSPQSDQRLLSKLNPVMKLDYCNPQKVTGSEIGIIVSRGSVEPEEETNQYIMGQYIKLFLEFEAMRNYPHYMVHNNFASIFRKMQKHHVSHQTHKPPKKPPKPQAVLQQSFSDHSSSPLGVAELKLP